MPQAEIETVRDAHSPQRLLHITDTHLLSAPGARLLGVDTADSLRAVLAQALGEYRPDAVLASGDIAHDGEPGAYRRFDAIVAEYFDGPRLCLAGNHDLSAAIGALPSEPGSLALPGWAVLGFDTHADGRSEARLGDRERRVLLERIAAARAPNLLLACHHPPVAVGCPWLDTDRIQDGVELLESLAGHERVRGLLFGHLHQVVDTTHRHLPVLGTPSTCFQFEPGSERFAVVDTMPDGLPGYRWLFLYPDGALRTEVRRVAGYPLNIDISRGS